MKKMEIGVLAMLRKGENPFPAIRDLGLTTAQVQNWDMENLNPETAAKVKNDIAESGIRLAAFWAGYTGKIVWNSYGGPETCGLVPRGQHEKSSRKSVIRRLLTLKCLLLYTADPHRLAVPPSAPVRNPLADRAKSAALLSARHPSETDRSQLYPGKAMGQIVTHFVDRQPALLGNG